MTDRLVDPTRQGIAAPEPEAKWAGRAKPVPLAEAISMVDAWAPDFAPFTMHQMCRALREHIDYLEQRLAETRIECGNRGSDLAEAREEIAEQADIIARIGNASWVARKQADDECADLQRIFDLRWAADMRAIAFWRADHPGNDLVWPDHVDMVVWLLKELDRQMLSRVNVEANIADVGEVEAECDKWFVRWWRSDEARKRTLAAVPCTAGIENCHAPYYRHQPCCNMRVALWPGEPFETDYLPDSGEVHLFAPDRGNKPRVSAGCVKLVEPTLYERNETLDWDRRAG